MKLSAGVALDLDQRGFTRETRTVRPVRGHRVEAVRDDQEVGGKRQLVAADAVVAASVHPLVVELDGAGLCGDELEALQQTRRQPRMTAHGRPLGSVEPTPFPQ